MIITSLPLAVIFTGGHCNADLLSSDYRTADLYIAADSGRLTAQRCGITPHVVAGDFDSSEKPACGNAEIVAVPAEKDFTDTMLACELAIARGFRRLLILGGTGGRIDHTFSNVFLLEGLKNRGVSAILEDGMNRIRLLQDESCTLAKEHFSYFSLIALEDARVSVTGSKYPLSDAPLKRDNPYAVSNEILEKDATVTVAGGSVLLIESDAH